MAIIVETGANVTNSNSYISEEDAVTYIETYTTRGADFVSYDTALFQLALIQAAKALDDMFGKAYLGVIATNYQSLLFPRSSFVDNNGRSITANTIPTPLKQAQVELALKLYDGDEVYVSRNQDAQITSKSVSIDGALSTDVSYARPVSDEAYTGMAKVEKIITPIINPSILFESADKLGKQLITRIHL